MKTLKFLHISDLHLDSPFKNISGILSAKEREMLIDSQYQSLTDAFNFAINNLCDFIIIAGDIFDSEYSSVLSQVKFSSLIELAEKNGLDIFLLLGNHDNDQINFLKKYNNIHIFSLDELEEINFVRNDYKINILGTSYQGQDANFLNESLIKIRDKKFELDNEKKSDFSIGIFHGEITNSYQLDKSSSYNTISLKLLEELNLDYVALGHIHNYQVIKPIKPLVCYSGTIQGRNLKPSECNDKGGIFVTLEDNLIKHEFVSFSKFIFKKEELIIESYEEIPELINKICKNLLNLYSDKKSYVVRLLLKIDKEVYKFLEEFREQEVFLNLLRDSLHKNNIFIEGLEISAIYKSEGLLYNEIIKEIDLEIDKLRLNQKEISDIVSMEYSFEYLEHKFDNEILLRSVSERLKSIL